MQKKCGPVAKIRMNLPTVDNLFVHLSSMIVSNIETAICECAVGTSLKSMFAKVNNFHQFSTVVVYADLLCVMTAKLPLGATQIP